MEFDAAVMAAYDTAARLQLRQMAEKYLESIYSSPDGLQICFEKLLASTTPTVNSLVRFACLKGVETIVLQRYAALTEAQRMYIRTNMFQFAQFLLHQNEDHGNKEKYCRIITGLITHEYLDAWPTLFTNFRQVIRSPEIERGSIVDQRALDIYQRLLACITDYIVDPEAHHSSAEHAHAMAIKDRMRVDCIPTIALDWVEILECYHEINPPLVVRTLGNIEKYIEWIDIGLIANPRALQAIFHGLSVQALQSASCKCIREIVEKGMDPSAKLQLLLSFGLMGIPHLQPSDEGFTKGLASLVDAIGQQLMPCLSVPVDATTQAQVSELLHGIFGQMFRFLAHESLEVSSQVISLAEAYLQRLKTIPITETEISELGALMQVITARMRYTAAYDFDDVEDYEESFQEYRKSLGKLFNAISRLVPEHVCGYIEQLLRNTLTSAPIRTIPMADVEVVLHMIATLNLEATHRDRLAAFFPVCIEAMIAGDIMTHGHPAVTLQFFELIHRYSKFVPDNPIYLSKILATFLDERALHNPSPRVRSRSAFLFLRVVKGLLPHLAPFVQPITQGLQPLLVVPALTDNQHLPIEDQCHLFEVQGSLLGYYPDSHATLLEFILAPIFESAQSVSATLGAQSDEKLGDYLARLISAVASFLKGFEKRNMTDTANRCIQAVVQLCGKSLELQPGNQAIQGKVVFCLHRVIECLPQGSIASIIAPFLPLLLRGMPEGNVPAMVELLQLLTQLVNRCKADIVPAIQPIFALLLHAVITHTAKSVSARSDEERESDFLRRQYFALLLSLYENSAHAIYDLERAQRHVLLNLLLTTCGALPSVSVSTIKPCIKIFRRMLLEWKADPEFQQFTIEHVIPLIFNIPFSPSFRQGDAESYQLLVEISSLQLAVVSIEAAQAHLANFLIQARRFDQVTIAEYMNTLISCKDPKAFATYFNGFISKHRSANR